MRFTILALATIIGLALASPIEADAGAVLSSRVNNCASLCALDGGVSSFQFHCSDFQLIRSIVTESMGLPGEMQEHLGAVR